jgi:hypothetical protein
MRVISFELLLRAVKEHGIDKVYTVLEHAFLTEPVIVINNDGKVVFKPCSTEELWDYLESLEQEEVEL